MVTDPSNISGIATDRGMKHIVVWCRTENLDGVSSALDECGFEKEMAVEPQEPQAVGCYSGIRGKMPERFLIGLEQNREVCAVEILMD